MWRIDATGAISTPGYAVQEDIPAQLIIEAHCPGELFERCFRIGGAGDILAPVEALGRRGIKRQVHAAGRNLVPGIAAGSVKREALHHRTQILREAAEEIGRASCRERVCQYV